MSPLPVRQLVAWLVLLLAVPTTAQERPVEEAEEAGGQTVVDEERRYDELVSRFQKDYLRFTTLVQVVPTIPFEDDGAGNEPRFDVAAAWLGIGGRLDGGIGYFVRGDFARSPTLLEAYVSYGSDDTRGIVGRQKVPFSAEFLTAAANIDFVNRARIVQRVAPGRAVGAQLRTRPGSGALSLRAGVFNATQTSAMSGQPLPARVRGGALVAGRAQADTDFGGGSVTLGANVAYNTPDTSDDVDSPGRLDLGVDARVRFDRFLLAGELIRSRYEDPIATDFTGLNGGYATLGFDVTPDDRLLARIDLISVEDDEDTSAHLLLGYNRALTRAASVQLNILAPLSDDDRPSFDQPAQALLNFQLTF